MSHEKENGRRQSAEVHRDGGRGTHRSSRAGRDPVPPRTTARQLKSHPPSTACFTRPQHPRYHTPPLSRAELSDTTKGRADTAHRHHTASQATETRPRSLNPRGGGLASRGCWLSLRPFLKAPKG